MDSVLRPTAYIIQKALYENAQNLPYYTEDNIIKVIKILLSAGINKVVLVHRLVELTIKYWGASLQDYSQFLRSEKNFSEGDQDALFLQLARKICMFTRQGKRCAI